MVDRARGRFRQDVAGQLQMVAEKAGLAATVTLDHERAVLEFDETRSDGALPRVIAAFDDNSAAASGCSEWMTLLADTGEERTALLSLGWRDDPALDEEARLQQRLAELETRTDERLPLESRGLNAQADERVGRYGRGDAIPLLAADLKRAAGRAQPAPPEQSHALVAIEGSPLVLPRAPIRGEQSEDSRQSAPRAGDIEMQRANVSELLIATLMQAVQRDLAEAESHFVGPGVAASARERLSVALHPPHRHLQPSARCPRRQPRRFHMA
jgi:hypothetical protein